MNSAVEITFGLLLGFVRMDIRGKFDLAINQSIISVILIKKKKLFILIIQETVYYRLEMATDYKRRTLRLTYIYIFNDRKT